METNTTTLPFQHEITLLQVGSTDLVNAVCSCGEYRSITCMPDRAAKLGTGHRNHHIRKVAEAEAAARRKAAMAIEKDRPPTRNDELAMRFDSDPDAIEWARGKILRLVERAERFEKHSNDSGSLALAARWHLAAAFMRQTMIGGEGCVIAAFDARLPQWVKAVRRGGDTG